MTRLCYHWRGKNQLHWHTEDILNESECIIEKIEPMFKIDICQPARDMVNYCIDQGLDVNTTVITYRHRIKNVLGSSMFVFEFPNENDAVLFKLFWDK